MARYEYYGSSAPASTQQSSYGSDSHPQIEMEKNRMKRVSGVKMVLGVVLCFGLMGAMIYSNVQQLQISNQITAKQQELTDLQSENRRMMSDLEGRTSIKNIQEYAEQVLGMRKIDPSQTEYIQIQKDDVVRLPEEEQNLFVRIKNSFDGFVEYLRG